MGSEITKVPCERYREIALDRGVQFAIWNLQFAIAYGLHQPGRKE